MLTMREGKSDGIEDIIFERKDIELFSIPDVKTRLDTLQNYFFPRLDKLIRAVLEDIQEVYEINVYEDNTVVRTPNHRKVNAKENIDLGFVRIGIGGKKKKNRPLTYLNSRGKPSLYHT